MHEVYAFGMIAPSTLIVLDDDYPPPGGYAEIAGVYPSFGGEAAGGAYVLARLGVDTKLDGTWLGNDPSSSFAIDTLSGAGVDCRAIRRGPKSVTEVVVSASDARTVLGTYTQLMADPAWNAPSEKDIRSSRIVCLDPFLGGESLQAARWCVDADTPYVTVDAPPDSEIGQRAAVLIVSEDFAAREFGPHDARELLTTYAARCNGLVILTRGSEPALYGRQGGQVREFAPYPVGVRDTTGAGDSFRAGAIYAMLNGADDDHLVRTASAVAALVCEGFPGVLNSPSEQELAEFLTRGR
ncbi:MAG TPA: carbohydrate kinase family protein [Ilumatobacteraceae bacterium]|nr:carbohydrate kinase family protein [Ilumatobacteraceae bacterium]